MLLPDGEPVHCMFMVLGEPPHWWERCETNATVNMGPEERNDFAAWFRMHPKAIINLYPASGNGSTYLCDKHDAMIQEVLS